MTFAPIEIKVDDRTVDRLLRRVEKAISPAALAAFLGGPVHKHFQDEIVERFAIEGDSKSGSWPWLSDATEEIRASQGFDPEGPINQRTGQLLDFVATQYELGRIQSGAELHVPGKPADSTLAEKLLHAQQGATSNPLPGAGPTPPRPVLAVDETDMEAIMVLLSEHIYLAIASRI